MEKVLLIANSEIDSWLQPMLEAAGYDADQVIRAASLAEGMACGLTEKSVILAGMELPDVVFPAQLDRLTENFPHIPIILLAETNSRDTVISAMRHGAQDVLVKGRVSTELLGKSLEDVVEKRIFREYQRLFEETPTPIYIFDGKTLDVLTVNRAAIAQYGYSRAEFLNLKATDLLPPGDIGRYWETDIDHDAGKWLHRKKNGDLFYIHVYAHTTVFEDREVKLLLAFNIDQKEKTEQALFEKTEELRNILESITDAFYTIDEDWRFTYANKEYERIQKLTREELIGHNIWELFPYKKQLRFFVEFERAVSEKISVHFEEYNTQNKMWVSVNAYPFKNGLAVYFRDITEQRRIQEKISSDEQNLRSIINNTKDLIWSVDKDYQIITGNLMFWNRIAYLTGKSGTLDNADLDPELLKIYVNYYKRAFKGEVYSVIQESAFPDQKYEELSLNPIYNQQQEVTGVNCFLRDISEQYDYLEKIEKQNTQLREIAWIQSHQVRAPLANILGLLQLLDPADRDDPQNAEIILKLQHSAGQLDEIVRDITSRTEMLNGTML